MFVNELSGDVICKHSSGAKFVVSREEIFADTPDLESAIRLAAKAALKQDEVALKQAEKDRWISERCTM